jgi:predicted dehydrogenase
VITPGPEWESGRVDLATMDAATIAQRQEWIASRVLSLQELDLSGHDRPLQAEIDSVLAAVQTGEEAEVTGEDGRAALELADRIVADIRAQGW